MKVFSTKAYCFYWISSFLFFAGVPLFALAAKPDLTIVKTNNVGGTVVNGTQFNWVFTITNSGGATADFKNNETVVTDALPTSGASYGSPTFSFAGGSSGSDTSCLISSNVLTCTSKNSNKVHIPVSGSMTIAVPVTPTATGTLINPKNNGTCMVDPDNKTDEGSNENNNTCTPNTVTVTLNTGTIVVKKVMVGGIDTFAFAGNPSGSISTNNGTLSTTLVAGTYTATETLLAGWDLTSVVCDDNDSIGSVNNHNATFHVAEGETVTCTFTNTKRATVIIKKVMVGGADTFNFSGTPSGSISTNNGTISANVTPGQYISTESAVSGWDLTSVACDDTDSVGSVQNQNATFQVAAGETVTCTFTNTKRASFSLQKISDPDNGSFQFDLLGPAQTGIPASHTFIPSGTWNLSNLLSGLYSLSETILSPAAWTGSQHIACTGSGNNNPSGSVANPFAVTLNPGETMSCTVNNTQDAIITGKKFEDMNADGLLGNDPGRSGWTVTATRTDVSADPVSAVTDTDGNYTLRIQPGTYKICETFQGGWLQSYPTASTTHSVLCDGNGRGYELTVAAADTISGNDFGNYQNGSISGFKWEDRNADGVFTNDEGVLDGWTIFLDTNNNGVLDTGELEQETGGDEEGFYSFENLAPGTYSVREVRQNGWTQTYPDNNKHEITITSGKNFSNINFGNFHNVTITGFKWDDTNGDGIWQKGTGETPGEPGLPNVTVALGKESGPEKNGNIPIEIIALSLTGTDGGFSIRDIGPGHYKLFEEKKDGWQTTNPVPHLDSFFDITYRIDLPDSPPKPASLVQNSFFDVFVELSGQNVNQSEATKGLITTIPGVPLEFGNHQLLVLSQETATGVVETSTVITWTTDRPGTSRVIYDTVSHTTLGDAPNYGYVFSTSETDTDPRVTSHSVAIKGLTGNTTYYYRTISKASPESVSGESSVTTASPTATPPPPSSSSSGGGGGGGGGGGSDSTGVIVQNTSGGGGGSSSGGLPSSSSSSTSGGASPIVLAAVSPATVPSQENIAEAKSSPTPSSSETITKTRVSKGKTIQAPAKIVSQSLGGSKSNRQTVSLLAAIASGITLGTGRIIVGLTLLLVLLGGGVFLVRKRWFK